MATSHLIGTNAMATSHSNAANVTAIFHPIAANVTTITAVAELQELVTANREKLVAN